jgi:PilZ domain
MAADNERRRHPRRAARVTARVEASGAALPGAVIDVSAGGLLFEIANGHAPPRLGVRARIVLVSDGVEIVRSGRVVRLRLAGRDRGAPMPRACAWVFDDGDDDAERRLARAVSAG